MSAKHTLRKPPSQLDSFGVHREKQRDTIIHIYTNINIRYGDDL